MRITNRMMAENAIRHMNDNTSRIGELQEQIASGKRYEAYSDNPSLAAAGMSLRSSLRAGEAYLETAAVVNEWISVTETALSQMITIAGEATNLALGGLSDTEGPAERQVRGVECACSAKRKERKLTGIEPPLHGYNSNSPLHVCVGHCQDAFSQILRLQG